MDFRERCLGVLHTLNLIDSVTGELVDLDSLGVVDLVIELEESCGIRIPNELVRAEAFQSIDTLVAMLRKAAARPASVTTRQAVG